MGDRRHTWALPLQHIKQDPDKVLKWFAELMSTLEDLDDYWVEIQVRKQEKDGD